jgi:hypothetical protein
LNRTPSTLQIGVRSGIDDGRKSVQLIIRYFNELRNDMRAGQEKIRRYKRGVRTDVKTQRNVIQDKIKTEESAVRNDVKDKLEKSMTAVSVGQEKLENRSLTRIADRLVADCWIQEKSCRVTIDTGACVTVARPHIVIGLPERKPSRQ